MPPAFNLSQDQTLQFDLEFTQRNRTKTIYIASFSFRERLKSEGPLSVAWQHHFTSNAHAYRLWILKEHRKTQSIYSLFASLTTFSCQQQRSEILICFFCCRQVFLKISFRITCRLAFATPNWCIAFGSSAAKRRDSCLPSQRRQVLFENFSKTLKQPTSLEGWSSRQSFQTSSASFANLITAFRQIRNQRSLRL